MRIYSRFSMPERGKCQACGRYADLERVELRVRGRVVSDRETCRACADAIEDAVKREAIERFLTRLSPGVSFAARYQSEARR